MNTVPKIPCCDKPRLKWVKRGPSPGFHLVKGKRLLGKLIRKYVCRNCGAEDR